MNMHVSPPRAPRRAMRPLRISIPCRRGAGPRAVLEAQVSFLIDLLDRMDPDPDFESYLAGFSGAQDDRERDDSDLEPNGDDEPSLGSLMCVDQSGWNAGGADDCEHDDADDEEVGWANPDGLRVVAFHPVEVPLTVISYSAGVRP